MALTCSKCGTECGNNRVKTPIYSAPAVKALTMALVELSVERVRIYKCSMGSFLNNYQVFSMKVTGMNEWIKGNSRPYHGTGSAMPTIRGCSSIRNLSSLSCLWRKQPLYLHINNLLSIRAISSDQSEAYDIS